MLPLAEVLCLLGMGWFGLGGDGEPTYSGDVAPILQRHCQECHRPGQVAPFSLLTYDQARKRAGDLLTVIDEHKMPPWHASTTVGGPFRDARVLDANEVATLAAWVHGNDVSIVNEKIGIGAGLSQGWSAEHQEQREYERDFHAFRFRRELG